MSNYDHERIDRESRLTDTLERMDAGYVSSTEPSEQARLAIRLARIAREAAIRASIEIGGAS